MYQQTVNERACLLVLNELTYEQAVVIGSYIAELRSKEEENVHLKRQLVNKNKQLRSMKASYRTLNDKYKKLNEERKPRFRNNGKKRVK